MAQRTIEINNGVGIFLGIMTLVVMKFIFSDQINCAAGAEAACEKINQAYDKSDEGEPAGSDGS